MYSEGNQGSEGTGSQVRIYSPQQWDWGWGEEKKNNLKNFGSFSSVLGVLCGVVDLDKGPEKNDL